MYSARRHTRNIMSRNFIACATMFQLREIRRGTGQKLIFMTSHKNRVQNSKNPIANTPTFGTTHNMALHEQARGKTDEWYTPPHVFNALGCTFDMDVASPGPNIVPWVPAKRWWDANSLERMWVGFIWMNPPFGGRNGIKPWLEKFFEHGNGVALTPDRTSCPWWQTYARKADSVLFVAPKIEFIDAAGQPGTSPAQGTTLMAAGHQAMEALNNAEVNGLGIVFKRP